MGKTGISLENVKIKNKKTILKLLNNSGSMSRKDIAQNVELTPAAVTMLCAEMISDNMLVEKGEIEEAHKVGRKKVSISINYQYKSVLAISIEKKYTYIFLCDLKGTIITSKTIKTNNNIPPKDFLLYLSKECKEMLWDSNQKIDNILGLGICIPGIVDRKRGVSVHAYGIWKEEVLVKSIMEEYMNLNTELENNVKAFAEGELLYGLGKKFNDLLFIKWGPGVGAAIIINNRVYEGKNNNAAEIGHYIIEKDGIPCQCGRHGCLETRVSITAIVKKIKSMYSEIDTPILYKSTNGDIKQITENWFSNLIKGTNKIPEQLSDELVVNSLNKNIERLARAIVNVITILSPAHTILLGNMMENDYMSQKLIDYCQNYDSTYNENFISRSSLIEKSYYIGPTAIIANKFFFD